MVVSMQERVADVVRAGIVSGDIKPGAALSEVALADELGVSRTPVREALKQLSTEGLVHVVPRVGTFVAEPSRRDIVELLELKELFEGFAASRLAQRSTVADRSRLEAAAGETAAFHEAVVTAADHRKLQLTYRWHMNQLPGAHPPCATADHGRIVELIAARDAHGAEQAMRDHVRASHRSLMQEVPR